MCSSKTVHYKLIGGKFNELIKKSMNTMILLKDSGIYEILLFRNNIGQIIFQSYICLNDLKQR